MTSVPRRVGYRVAYGAVALIAVVSSVLIGESPAGAATESHSPRIQQGPPSRDIRHERLIRNIKGKSPSKQAARPWRLDIPSIGVAAGLMPLGGPEQAGSAGDLSLPTPPLAKAASDAGWYRFSAVPGTAGNAVIVGHVDTYAGPGVFYDLYELRPGDAIYVNTGGARQRFDVITAREVSKPSFPVNQVFGATGKHMLWLITCGGAFDYETRHYLDNIVISAAWAPVSGKHPGRSRK